MKIRGSTRVGTGGQTRHYSVRVVEGLPCGYILGAFFLGKHSSFIKFVGAGTFKPALQSPWVMFKSCGGGIPGKGVSVGAAM